VVFLLLVLSDVCCSTTIPYIWASDWRMLGNHLKKSWVVTSTEFIAVSAGGCRAKDAGNSGLVAVSSSGGVNGGLLGGSRLLSRAGGMAGVGGPSVVINGDIWLGNRIWALLRWTECSIEQITRSIEQITWSILTIIRSIELII
jgi:hypothetical protein